MANRFIHKTALGTEASPSAITDTTAGKALVQNIGKAAGFVYDRAANFFKYNGNDAIKTLVDAESAQTLLNKTLTAPTLTAPVITGALTIGAGAVLTTPVINGPTGTQSVENTSATRLLLAADSGKTFYFGHASTEFDFTLPAVAAGLHFRFIMAVETSGTPYTIISPAANIVTGFVLCAGGTAEDVELTGTTIEFVSTAASLGDLVEIESDGVSWFVRGFCALAGGITISG